MKLFVLRSLFFLLLWAPCAYWTIQYAEHEFNQRRFESLVLTNGRIASIQREMVFKKEKSVQSGDRIVRVADFDFEWPAIKDWITRMPAGIMVDVEIESFRGQTQQAQMLVRSYSSRDVLVLFLLPTLLSVVFLGFSIFTASQKFTDKKNQEALECFSFLCLLVSFFFLGFFPSVTFGIPLPSSLLLPLMGAALFHLFFVYPKKKARPTVRISLVSLVYAASLALMFLRALNWTSVHSWWFSLLDVLAFGLCAVAALALLGNTLFTSRDFWTKRRARLLSVGFLVCFVAVLSVLFSFLWEGPRVSLERLLAVSLLFPVLFAFVFSKENVFDIERLFKRGIHQILFLGIAVVLAVLVGISLQKWTDTSERDWLIWTTIAMVVALFARPMVLVFEQALRKIAGTEIPFPDVDHLLSQSKSMEDFLIRFCRESEGRLNMQNIVLRFFKDPLKDWSSNNEQIWSGEGAELKRHHRLKAAADYRRTLVSGDRYVGEIQFSGGDALGFDPFSSAGFNDYSRKLARCLELFVYREFLLTQQGLLAVGRMQALLAHELKNPLAVIKVCAGLLPDRLDGSEEASEIVRTIQEEIERVSEGVQSIFNHSGKDEKPSSFDLFRLIQSARSEVLARFAEGEIRVSFLENGKAQKWEKNCLWINTQREGFRQSLINLLVNAFEAGSPWVHIQIELQKAGGIKISVEDRGPGISTEIELFKPFVTTKSGGTGLGLSHVKEFVDRQSGQIQVFSPAEGGTKFVMEFSVDLVEKKGQSL